MEHRVTNTKSNASSTAGTPPVSPIEPGLAVPNSARSNASFTSNCSTRTGDTSIVDESKNTSAVKVYVRVRPFNDREIEKLDTLPTVRIGCTDPTGITILDPKEGHKAKETHTFERCFWSIPATGRGAVDIPQTAQESASPGRRQSIVNLSASFNRVPPPPFSSQSDVYEHVGRGVLDNALEGYNGCIFAYGQTGSGKTFTMMGFEAASNNNNTSQLVPVAAESKSIANIINSGGNSPTNAGEDTMHIHTATSTTDLATASTSSNITYTPTVLGEYQGIIPRLGFDVFDQLRQRRNKDSSVSFKVECQYYEIYNEKVFDLVCPENNDDLKVRQHPTTGPFVEFLSSHTVTHEGQIFALIRKGTTERHTAATKMNERSSRSHAILTIILTQSKIDPEDNSIHTMSSKVNLVDLAGSERTSQSGVVAEHFHEATKINLSLTTLGRVIDSLADSSAGKAAMRPPYRESFLTWLLMDSLGGNSKTTMVATISPATSHYDEMMNTLRYASRAKQIVNTVVVNEDPAQRKVKELTIQVERLRRQLREIQTSKISKAQVDELNQTIDKQKTTIGTLRARVHHLEQQMHEQQVELEGARRLHLQDKMQFGGSPGTPRRREGSPQTLLATSKADMAASKGKPPIVSHDVNTLRRLLDEERKKSHDLQRKLDAATGNSPKKSPDSKSTFARTSTSSIPTPPSIGDANRKPQSATQELLNASNSSVNSNQPPVSDSQARMFIRIRELQKDLETKDKQITELQHENKKLASSASINRGGGGGRSKSPGISPLPSSRGSVGGSSFGRTTTGTASGRSSGVSTPLTARGKQSGSDPAVLMRENAALKLRIKDLEAQKLHSSPQGKGSAMSRRGTFSSKAKETAKEDEEDAQAANHAKEQLEKAARELQEEKERTETVTLQYEEQLAELKVRLRDEEGKSEANENALSEAITTFASKEHEEGAKFLYTAEKQLRKELYKLDADWKNRYQKLEDDAKANADELAKKVAEQKDATRRAIKVMKDAAEDYRKLVESEEANVRKHINKQCAEIRATVQAMGRVRMVRELEEKNLELKVKHAKEMQELELSLRSDMTQEAATQLRAKSEERRSNLATLEAEQQRIRDQAVTDLSEKHEEELAATITEQQTKQEEAIADLKQQHDDDLDTLKAEHEATVLSTKEFHERELEETTSKMQDDHAAAIEELKAEHESALNEAVTKHQEEQGAATEDRDAAMATLKEQHEEELAATITEQQTKQDEALAELKQQHGEEVEKLKTDHDATVAAVKEQLEQERDQTITKMQEEHATAIEELKAEHEAALNEVVTKHDAEQDATTQGHNAEVASLKEKHEEELAATITEREEKQEKALAELKQQHDEEVEKLKADHDVDVAAVKEQLEQEHKDAMEKLEDDHQSALSVARAVHKEDLAVARDRLQQQFLEEARARSVERHEEHVTGLKVVQTDASAELTKVREETTSLYESQLEKTKAAHSEELSSTRGAHEKAMENLREEHEEATSNAERQHKRKIAALQEDHEQELEAAKRRADKERNQSATKHEEELDELQRKHASELTAVRREAESDLQKKESELMEKLNTLEKEHNAKVQALHGEMREKEQSHDEAVQEQAAQAAEKHRVGRIKKMLALVEAEEQTARNDLLSQCYASSATGLVATYRAFNATLTHLQQGEHQRVVASWNVAMKQLQTRFMENFVTEQQTLHANAKKEMLDEFKLIRSAAETRHQKMSEEVESLNATIKNKDEALSVSTADLEGMETDMLKQRESIIAYTIQGVQDEEAAARLQVVNQYVSDVKLKKQMWNIFVASCDGGAAALASSNQLLYAKELMMRQLCMEHEDMLREVAVPLFKELLQIHQTHTATKNHFEDNASSLNNTIAELKLEAQVKEETFVQDRERELEDITKLQLNELHDLRREMQQMRERYTMEIDHLKEENNRLSLNLDEANLTLVQADVNAAKDSEPDGVDSSSGVFGSTVKSSGSGSPLNKTSGKWGETLWGVLGYKEGATQQPHTARRPSSIDLHGAGSSSSPKRSQVPPLPRSPVPMLRGESWSAGAAPSAAKPHSSAVSEGGFRAAPGTRQFSTGALSPRPGLSPRPNLSNNHVSGATNRDMRKSFSYLPRGGHPSGSSASGRFSTNNNNGPTKSTSSGRNTSEEPPTYPEQH